ncbi:flagellar basal body-associated FliL family protein [Desulfofundulus sp. TPOSR]|jgi:flagellar FliL protein|uniref:flagellar basal body-associated FliL family protein n=1 Tax=Desulfofundulus sp. TPOSR TaxID=2714340 RepID=UPI0014087647|nr:flagellar basal body-associated FliL family protein [Desulfofundulus sp. TPOSR]NHM28215.1 flagellar basal body-associated FliL family protein [Desulfofundulus sp. TPOSR]
MPVSRKKQTGDENEKKRGGRGRTILLLLLAVIIGGGATFGALWFLGPLSKPVQATPKERPMETLDLGDRVINLADEGPSRYLRVQVVLEYPHDKKLVEEIKAKQPMLTEAVLTILRGKTSDEVLPVKNQEAIKKEILDHINSQLLHGKVERLYFTDFLVQ